MAVDPDSEIITDTIVTAGDVPVAEDLIDDLLDGGEDAQVLAGSPPLSETVMRR